MSSTPMRDISQSSYPDFVGMTGQQNTPPGGFATVRTWIDQSSMTADSFVLDLACSTGFSGREVNADTDAQVHGIDISATAIETARQLSKTSRMTYQVADAARLPLADSTFTHVLGGCNFGFISDREGALNEVKRVLQPNGALCVASFFYRNEPSTVLLDRVESAIGFRPRTEDDYVYWDGFFKQHFDLAYESVRNLEAEPVARVSRRVRSAIRGSKQMKRASREQRLAATERLQFIRETLNEHRSYQGLSVAIWRRRAV